MGKRKVIIELRISSCQLSQYTLYLGHVSASWILQAHCRDLPTHESRFGITSNMTVDWVARELNSIISWRIDGDVAKHKL